MTQIIGVSQQLLDPAFCAGVHGQAYQRPEHGDLSWGPLLDPAVDEVRLV